MVSGVAGSAWTALHRRSRNGGELRDLQSGFSMVFMVVFNGFDGVLDAFDGRS